MSSHARAAPHAITADPAASDSPARPAPRLGSHDEIQAYLEQLAADVSAGRITRETARGGAAVAHAATGVLRSRAAAERRLEQAERAQQAATKPKAVELDTLTEADPPSWEEQVRTARKPAQATTGDTGEPVDVKGFEL